MKVTAAHRDDLVRFDFDGVTLGPMKPSFVECKVEDPLRIARIEPVATEITASNNAEARVTIRTEDGQTVSGSFGVGSDDAMICKKPLSFERSFRVEVIGPEKQRVRFALTGRLIPKDE